MFRSLFETHTCFRNVDEQHIFIKNKLDKDLLYNIFYNTRKIYSNFGFILK